MVAKSNDATTFSTPSDRKIVMTRVFDAPRELVFKAYTDPQAISQWWGPRGSTTTVDKMDVKPGGIWRFINRDQDGGEYPFNGVFQDITPPDLLSYTFEWEGLPGHIVFETVTFEEHDGKTTVTATALFDSVEDRDGMLSSGMESGARESWGRLTEYLQTQG
jgi:uncharacterized protein YndB with AHSA1/START domain